MRTLTIFAVLISPVTTWADLRIDRPSLDLGDIRGGTTVECAFKLKNDGQHVIELVDLERSCGCVEPRWSSRVLKPGAETTLSLRLRTLGQAEGPRVWPLVVVTRVGGEVQKQRVEIKGVVRNEIVLQPPQVALYVTKSLEQEITLTDHRDRPLTVMTWDAKMPGVRVEQIASKPGTTRLKLTVDGAQLPPGRTDHILHLFTNDLRYDHLEVPITLVRVVKSRVTWSPETPEVILAPGQIKASTLIRVSSGDGPPLAIEKVESSDAGVTCTFHQGLDGCLIRVTVERAAFVRRGVQTSVRIVGAGEPIAIPVVVRIE